MHSSASLSSTAPVREHKCRPGSLTDCSRKIMPMASEVMAEEHKRKEMSAHGFSLISATCAVVMIIVGSLYWPEDQCRTGAASYLYYGGVFSLTINILSLASSAAKWWALKVNTLIGGGAHCLTVFRMERSA